MVDNFKVSARMLQGKSRPALDTLEQKIMTLVAFLVRQAKHIYFISSNNQHLMQKKGFTNRLALDFCGDWGCAAAAG